MSTPALKRHETVHCSTFFLQTFIVWKEFFFFLFFLMLIKFIFGHAKGQQTRLPNTLLTVMLKVQKQDPECREKRKKKKVKKRRFSNEELSCGREQSKEKKFKQGLVFVRVCVL